MIITNDISSIEAKDIDSFTFTENDKQQPCISVMLKRNKEVQMALSDGFGIHKCNEFLGSLNVINEEFICFHGFEGGLGYIELIKNCNELFQIRKVMEDVTGKEYSHIGLMASQVRSCILDKLSIKYKRNVLQEAYQTNTLGKYVAEALTYLK
ncbi:MAG TPA: hypothetical protein GX401_03245 [Clostridiales bacterium]|nr:hypothetical protein [Clostridiales bacterium]